MKFELVRNHPWKSSDGTGRYFADMNSNKPKTNEGLGLDAARCEMSLVKPRINVPRIVIVVVALTSSAFTLLGPHRSITSGFRPPLEPSSVQARPRLLLFLGGSRCEARLRRAGYRWDMPSKVDASLAALVFAPGSLARSY